MTDRVPPYNDEAEAAVIGAMIVSPASIPVALDRLAPGDFWFTTHTDIFHAVAKLWNGSPTSVDQITLANMLPEHREYIHTLADNCFAVSNIAYHADIVAHAAYCRKLIDAGRKITEIGYEDGEDISALVDKAEATVYKLRPSSDKDTKLAKDVAHLIMYECETSQPPKKVSSGFRSLDEIAGGLHASNLIIVGARPGVGKTAVGLAISHNVAKEGTVLFVSLEMSQKELMERLLCSLASVPVVRLRNREISIEETARIYGILGEIEKSDLRIIDNPSLTMMALKSKARQYASKTDVKLIVVDYIQLLTLGTRSQSRQEEVTGISKELKILARELQVPIIALCQLNRQSVFDGTEPDISHLRESGSLEQDADQVWLLSWPKDKDFGGYDSISINIAKNRHGPMGKVSLPWNKSTQRIEQ